MVKLGVVLFALVATACFEDRYRCVQDSDCDLGEAGRCDDGLCTQFDPACDTARSYSAHTGQEAVCFDGRVALANPCAAGQPPAIADGCAADVCSVLPACCETAWSDACVQQAERTASCGTCDTRLAITAQAGTTTELWQIDWNGTAWKVTDHRTDRRQRLAWIAPPPGGQAPRLVGLGTADGELLVDDRPIAIATDRIYRSIASVDVDRSGRDTIALGFAGTARGIAILDLDSLASRTITTTAVDALAWGDTDRDAFPDAVGGQNQRYTLMPNIEDDVHARVLATTQNSNMGDPPDGTPPLRRVDWADLDGDGQLDLVMFGSQIRMHAAAGALPDTPFQALDCDPPVLLGMCAVEKPNAYAGAALPGAQAALIAASNPTRHVYRFVVERGKSPVVTTLADPCPTCPPILAVVTRDLDRDHELDVIAIDANLRVFVGLASAGYALVDQKVLQRGTTFGSVDVSVGGAVIP
ncbi:MAG TPA: hypothetical protein VFQ53_29995 [Kofleriaceae bacterium]|nr:hypothetical protein [Kofleriaceae bacterium]